MSQRPPFRDGPQFSAEDLTVIVETIEAALQMDGFVDTTSSGGASPEERSQILAGLQRVHAKASSLIRLALVEREARLWYVWQLDDNGYQTASPREIRSASAAGALAQAEETDALGCTDVTGWKVIEACSQLDAVEEAESLT